MATTESTLLFFIIIACACFIGTQAGTCINERLMSTLRSNGNPRETFAAIYSNGDGINRSFRLVSGNPNIAGQNKYVLKISDDGALRVWRMTSEKCPNRKEIVWGSGTAGQGVGPYRAILGTAGNFVIRDAQDTLIWQTNTKNKGEAPYYLQMLQSGNLVLKDNNAKVIWQTGIP